MSFRFSSTKDVVETVEMESSDRRDEVTDSLRVELLEGDSDNSESFSCSRRLSRGGIPTANGSSFWGVPARQRSWRSVVVADLGEDGAEGGLLPVHVAMARDSDTVELPVSR